MFSLVFNCRLGVFHDQSATSCKTASTTLQINFNNFVWSRPSYNQAAAAVEHETCNYDFMLCCHCITGNTMANQYKEIKVSRG